MVEVLQRRISPDEVRFGVASSTLSHLLIASRNCNIAFRVYKLFINIGSDSSEGHSIKAMMSISMVEVLQARSRPDDA